MILRETREYFRKHQGDSLYARAEVPSYAAQLAARDHLLRMHPKLRFDSLHLASLEWDVDEVARFLDRFPQANVDLAGRLSYLEYQASSKRDKVKKFLIRYQDRIVYGTDLMALGVDRGGQLARYVHSTWLRDWRFLNTDMRMRSTEFASVFCGLALPQEVVDKIYRLNAERMFPEAWKQPGQVKKALK
jgi:predicted TIM-barrel fold metal-dependent hydrolase